MKTPMDRGECRDQKVFKQRRTPTKNDLFPQSMNHSFIVQAFSPVLCGRSIQKDLPNQFSIGGANPSSPYAAKGATCMVCVH